MHVAVEQTSRSAAAAGCRGRQRLLACFCRAELRCQQNTQRRCKTGQVQNKSTRRQRRGGTREEGGERGARNRRTQEGCDSRYGWRTLCLARLTARASRRRDDEATRRCRVSSVCGRDVQSRGRCVVRQTGTRRQGRARALVSTSTRFGAPANGRQNAAAAAAAAFLADLGAFERVWVCLGERGRCKARANKTRREIK